MLTAIITNYNYADLVGEAIESALSQGCEVIVVDNASTDDSRAVIESFDCVKVFHEVNTNTCTLGCNEGLDLATGEWVIFLDADDVLLDAEELTRHDCDWLVANLQVGGSVWDYSRMPRDLESAREYARVNRSLPVSMKGSFRLDWIRENGLRYLDWQTSTYAFDMLTCLEWLKASPRIAHTTTPCVRYTFRGADRYDAENIARMNVELSAYLGGAS